MLCLQIGWTLTDGRLCRKGSWWGRITKIRRKRYNWSYQLSGNPYIQHRQVRRRLIQVPELQHEPVSPSVQYQHIPTCTSPPPSPSSEYNSARYYWSQSMINNNNIDKNGTLVLTSDLICRPLCTLWCIQYHNHAWVHLVWKRGVGGRVGDQWARSWAERKHHTCRYCVDRALESKRGNMPRRPLIHRLTCSPASVQQ